MPLSRFKENPFVTDDRYSFDAVPTINAFFFEAKYVANNSVVVENSFFLFDSLLCPRISAFY